MEIEKPNGGVRLPIGFRFRPTDEELLVHYLKRKVYSVPLPASIIPEQDVFHTNPWDLPGELREKRYFFSRRKVENVKRRSSVSVVAAGCGYWKALGQDKQIMVGGVGVIGIRKSLVFYQGKRPAHGITRTPWVMHLYSLVHSLPTLCPRPTAQKNFMIQVGDWVVCRIYQMKRKPKKSGSNKQESNATSNMLYSKIENKAHLGGHGPGPGPDDAQHTSSSSSCSSGITHHDMIPLTELDQEVTSHDY